MRWSSVGSGLGESVEGGTASSRMTSQVGGNRSTLVQK